MSESKEIMTMRAMEWERVKGRIKAILVSYWDLDDTTFNELNKISDEFITKFGELGGID